MQQDNNLLSGIWWRCHSGLNSTDPANWETFPPGDSRYFETQIVERKKQQCTHIEGRTHGKFKLSRNQVRGSGSAKYSYFSMDEDKPSDLVHRQTRFNGKVIFVDPGNSYAFLERSEGQIQSKSAKRRGIYLSKHGCRFIFDQTLKGQILSYQIGVLPHRSIGALDARPLDRYFRGPIDYPGFGYILDSSAKSAASADRPRRKRGVKSSVPLSPSSSSSSPKMFRDRSDPSLPFHSGGGGSSSVIKKSDRSGSHSSSFKRDSRHDIRYQRGSVEKEPRPPRIKHSERRPSRSGGSRRDRFKERPLIAKDRALSLYDQMIRCLSKYGNITYVGRLQEVINDNRDPSVIFAGSIKRRTLIEKKAFSHSLFFYASDIVNGGSTTMKKRRDIKAWKPGSYVSFIINQKDRKRLIKDRKGLAKHGNHFALRAEKVSLIGSFEQLKKQMMNEDDYSMNSQRTGVIRGVPRSMMIQKKDDEEERELRGKKKGWVYSYIENEMLPFIIDDECLMSLSLNDVVRFEVKKSEDGGRREEEASVLRSIQRFRKSEVYKQGWLIRGSNKSAKVPDLKECGSFSLSERKEEEEKEADLGPALIRRRQSCFVVQNSELNGFENMVIELKQYQPFSKMSGCTDLESMINACDIYINAFANTLLRKDEEDPHCSMKQANQKGYLIFGVKDNGRILGQRNMNRAKIDAFRLELDMMITHTWVPCSINGFFEGITDETRLSKFEKRKYGRDICKKFLNECVEIDFIPVLRRVQRAASLRIIKSDEHAIGGDDQSIEEVFDEIPDTYLIKVSVKPMFSSSLMKSKPITKMKHHIKFRNRLGKCKVKLHASVSEMSADMKSALILSSDASIHHSSGDVSSSKKDSLDISVIPGVIVDDAAGSAESLTSDDELDAEDEKESTVDESTPGMTTSITPGAGEQIKEELIQEVILNLGGSEVIDRELIIDVLIHTECDIMKTFDVFHLMNMVDEGEGDHSDDQNHSEEDSAHELEAKEEEDKDEDNEADYNVYAGHEQVVEVDSAERLGPGWD